MIIDYEKSVLPLLEERKALKKKFEENEKAYDKIVKEYRIQSVIRVLDNLHRKLYTNKTDYKEIEKLIVHCLNKLHGNIDGIELTFSGGEQNEKLSNSN